MSTIVLKLFAGQGTGRTKRRLYASPFGEHKNLDLPLILPETNEVSLDSHIVCYSIEKYISITLTIYQTFFIEPWIVMYVF